MVEFDNTRRLVIAAGAGLLLAGASPQIARAAEKHDDEKEVSAVEDLMREHGVIRRAILVYRDMAAKLRAKPTSLDPDLLRRTAMMLRKRRCCPIDFLGSCGFSDVRFFGGRALPLEGPEDERAREGRCD